MPKERPSIVYLLGIEKMEKETNMWTGTNATLFDISFMQANYKFCMVNYHNKQTQDNQSSQKIK